MKTNVLLFLSLITVCQTAQSQFLINAGETYTFEFSSMGTPTVTPGFNITGLTLTPTFSGYDRFADSITIEAFEDNTSQTPWCAHAYVKPDPSLDHCGDSIHWSDHQGVVRITVLSGSVTLDSMSFYRQEPVGFGNTAVYNMTVVPSSVPEPGTLSLLGVAGLAGVIWCARRKAGQRTI